VTPDWPQAGGEPSASALLRSSPEDFRVDEQLGFEPSGEGEHIFLQIEKRQLNTQDLVQRVSRLSGIPERDIGFSGMKDRNAVTSQWLSVRMAGKAEPDWHALEGEGDIRLLEARRHLRKLKRGVHRGNRFSLRLRELSGDQEALQQRLETLKVQGVPNYFGIQRFGRNGATLEQARHWMARGGRKISRNKRSLYLSAQRGYLFNHLLAVRVRAGNWKDILLGDVCMLQGSRSLFHAEEVDESLRKRALQRDIHPGLPLWGKGDASAALDRARQDLAGIDGAGEICDFLERAGLELAWRPARMLADDFCWQFCDDGSLQLDFALGAGSYATALLDEFVRFTDAGIKKIANKKEQGIE